MDLFIEYMFALGHILSERGELASGMGRGPGEAREGVDGSFEMVQTGSSSSLPQQQGPTLKHAQTLQPERAQGSSSLPGLG
ncbi:hypothetical protein KUCAC02_010894 [Chaenocephalus aceratus]|uniref:Uncharacterized protein n=1 Tax=Chaenocephalus aceratus TaxID=36190 RepID=A0ACB9WU40_CHAAC|nr:hypothetical protein KUCAC02_010894 [Chaenocephalus aceratus]